MFGLNGNANEKALISARERTLATTFPRPGIAQAICSSITMNRPILAFTLMPLRQSIICDTSYPKYGNSVPSWRFHIPAVY